MSEPLLYRFAMWLCEKTGHLITHHSWIYNGYYHRECRICGRIKSEPLREGKDEDAKTH